MKTPFEIAREAMNKHKDSAEVDALVKLCFDLQDVLRAYVHAVNTAGQQLSTVHGPGGVQDKLKTVL